MNERSPSQARMFLAFTAIYVVWGSTYLAIRYAVETIPPLFMMGTRSIAAGLILIVWGRARGGEQLRWRHLPALVTIGALFFLVGHGLLAWAEIHVASGLAAVLVASEALWIVAVESTVARRPTVGVRGAIGLFLGFLGIVLLVGGSQGAGGWSGETIAAIAIVIGAMSWSIGAVYSKTALVPKNPPLTAGAELLIGGALLLTVGTALGEGNGFQLAAVSGRSLAGLAYLIVFGSVVAFSSYIWLLSVTTATRISTHAYVNPVIAVLLGWLTAGEELTTNMAIATTVIVLSVYLVLNDRGQERRRTSDAANPVEELPPN